MDDTQTIWNFRDLGVATTTPSTDEHAGAAIERRVADAAAGAPDAASAQAITPLHEQAAVSLHPELRLIITRSLHGDAVVASNLCMVVGTMTREYRRNGRNRRTTSPTADDARTVRTPLGTTETILHLDVQEVLGDGVGAALTAYRIPLHVHTKLAATEVFADGQRVAICGPLRMERTYDARFAADDLDPGMAAWKLRLDVITMQPLSDDADIPDGSWVQLAGDVEDDPIVRLRPISPLATVPFASVRLRCRMPLRGGFASSQARFHSSVLIPLDVPLDGGLAHAGTLLKRGNQVRIEGRLIAYQLRRRPDVPERAPQLRRERAALLQDALSRTEARVRSSGGDDRRVRAAKQQLLTDTQLAVSVGYVALRHGTELLEEQIAELIASRPRRVRGARTDTRSPRPEPEPEQIIAALDEATNAKLGDVREAADTGAGDESLAEETAVVRRERPRRRTREAAEELTTAADDS